MTIPKDLANNDTVQSYQAGAELEDMDLEMDELDAMDEDEESESRPRKKARK